MSVIQIVLSEHCPDVMIIKHAKMAAHIAIHKKNKTVWSKTKGKTFFLALEILYSLVTSDCLQNGAGPVISSLLSRRLALATVKTSEDVM